MSRNYIRITDEPFRAVAINVKTRAEVDVTDFLKEKLGVEPADNEEREYIVALECRLREALAQNDELLRAANELGHDLGKVMGTVEIAENDASAEAQHARHDASLVLVIEEQKGRIAELERLLSEATAPGTVAEPLPEVAAEEVVTSERRKGQRKG